MKKEKPVITEDQELPVDKTGETAPEVKKTKAKRFWEYVTDYKRTTVALTLPSAVFDISYSGFLFAMSIIFMSYWLFMMSFYTFLLFCIRINVLYRAGRGAVFKGKRFSERRNYSKFSWKLIFLDAVIAFNMFIIVRFNVLHNYAGFLIYVFGIYTSPRSVPAPRVRASISTPPKKSSWPTTRRPSTCTPRSTSASSSTSRIPRRVSSWSKRPPAASS